MNSRELVSVVIPTYNRAKTLPRAIDSVLNQSYKKWELFIVDDGSTDGTEQMIKERYGQDYRINFSERPESRAKGANACRNIGIEKANGEYIAFLDSDDEWHEDHLEKKIEFLDMKNIDGVFGGYNKIFKTYLGNSVKTHCIQVDIQKYEKSDSIGSYLFERENSDVRTSTMMYKRKAINDIKFDEKLNKHQDWDLAIRFDKEYTLITEPNITVNLILDDSYRISSGLNHRASKYFLEKNSNKLSANSKAWFLFQLAKNTVFMEVKNEHYHYYKNKVLELNPSLYYKSRLLIIDIPIVGDILLNIWKMYLEYKLKR